MKMNCVLASLILQDKEKIWKIITSHRQVRMHVKVILVDLFFARLMEKLYWSVLYLMEVDAAKKENLEFTEKSTFSKNGSKQVNQKGFNVLFFWSFQYLPNHLFSLLQIQFKLIILWKWIFSVRIVIRCQNHQVIKSECDLRQSNEWNKLHSWRGNWNIFCLFSSFQRGNILIWWIERT